jgi:hypothetical protein
MKRLFSIDRYGQEMLAAAFHPDPAERVRLQRAVTRRKARRDRYKQKRDAEKNAAWNAEIAKLNKEIAELKVLIRLERAQKRRSRRRPSPDMD